MDIAQKCADLSPNVETLKFVHQKFNLFPKSESIEQYIKAGNLEAIEYIQKIKPELLRAPGVFIQAALI